jgi:hypothetical protein
MWAAAPFFSRGRNPALPTDRDKILVGSQTFEAVIVARCIYLLAMNYEAYRCQRIVVVGSVTSRTS